MILLLFVSDGQAMTTMGYGESFFCDFWAHLNRILNYDSIYGNLADADAIFPPLAYCFLMIFAVPLTYKNASLENFEMVKISGYGMLIFTMPPLINIQGAVLIGIYISWIIMILLISFEKIYYGVMRFRKLKH